MAFRDSIDSNDPGITLLLNDTLLDQSDFINHVSIPPSDDLDGSFHPSRYWRQPLWKRILPSSFKSSERPRRRSSNGSHTDGSCLQCNRMWFGRRKSMRWCMILGLGTLLILGVIQLLTLLGSLVSVFFPEDIQQVLESWGQIGQTGDGLNSWPTDFTRDIRPIPCHSHNDYWRKVPFYSAISTGCTSVEADVWLFDEELYVGHSTSSLTQERTLKTLYIDPILELLIKQNPTTKFHPNGNTSRNGVFDTDSSQTLTLLIDFKTAGPATWPYVFDALEPLRAHNYLTRWNGTNLIPGPVVVVGTGNTPFDHVTSNTSNPYHDIFFDAPLDEMWEDREWEEAHQWPEWDEGTPGEVLVEDEGSAEEDRGLGDYPWGQGRHIYKPKQHKSYPKSSKKPIETTITLDEGSDSHSTATNKTALLHPDIFTPATSFYASVSFGKTIGRMWRYRMSPRQMGLIRGQIRGAHRRGLKVRYWDLPDWPISLRNHVWDVLVREGVDILNVDDLRAATHWDWRRRKSHRL